jgi:hypothetical protein
MLRKWKTPETVDAWSKGKQASVDKVAARRMSKVDRSEANNNCRKVRLKEKKEEIAANEKLEDESTINLRILFVTPVKTFVWVIFSYAEFQVILYSLEFFPFVKRKYHELLAVALAVMTAIAGDVYLHSLNFIAPNGKEFLRKRLAQIASLFAFLAGLLCVALLAAFRSAVFVTDMQIKFGEVKEYEWLMSVGKYVIPFVIIAIAIGVGLLNTVLLHSITEGLRRDWPSFLLYWGQRRANGIDSKIAAKRKRIEAWKQNKCAQVNKRAELQKEKISRTAGKDHKFARWFKHFFYGNGEYEEGHKQLGDASKLLTILLLGGSVIVSSCGSPDERDRSDKHKMETAVGSKSLDANSEGSVISRTPIELTVIYDLSGSQFGEKDLNKQVVVGLAGKLYLRDVFRVVPIDQSSEGHNEMLIDEKMPTEPGLMNMDIVSARNRCRKLCENLDSVTSSRRRFTVATSIVGALNTPAVLESRSDCRRFLVLVTDGEETSWEVSLYSDFNPSDVVGLLKNDGRIPELSDREVYMVGPSSERVDERHLHKIRQFWELFFREAKCKKFNWFGWDRRLMMSHLNQIQTEGQSSEDY